MLVSWSCTCSIYFRSRPWGQLSLRLSYWWELEYFSFVAFSLSNDSQALSWSLSDPCYNLPKIWKLLTKVEQWQKYSNVSVWQTKSFFWRHPLIQIPSLWNLEWYELLLLKLVSFISFGSRKIFWWLLATKIEVSGSCSKGGTPSAWVCRNLKVIEALWN